MSVIAKNNIAMAHLYENYHKDTIFYICFRRNRRYEYNNLYLQYNRQLHYYRWYNLRPQHGKKDSHQIMFVF